MLSRRMLQDAVQDAGPVEPGGDREPPGHGGELEPAGLLHPPDVQLQVRAVGGQRVQAVLGAPGQVAAQVGFGAVAGDAREAGQAGSHRQPQPAGERRQRVGRHGGQVGEGHHVLTLRRLPIAVKLTVAHPARHHADGRETCVLLMLPAGPRVRRRAGCGLRAEARWCTEASLDEHPARTIRTLV